MQTLAGLLVAFGLAAGASVTLPEDLPANTPPPARPGNPTVCGVVRAVRTADGAKIYLADVPFVLVTHPLGQGRVATTEYLLDDKNRLGTFDAADRFREAADGVSVMIGDEVWVRFSSHSNCTLHVGEHVLEAEGSFSHTDANTENSRAAIPYDR